MFSIVSYLIYEEALYPLFISSSFVMGNLVTLFTFNNVDIINEEIIIEPRNQINIGDNTYICFQNKPLKVWNIIRHLEKTLEDNHEDEYLIKSFCKTYKLSQESLENSLLALQDICLKSSSPKESKSVDLMIKRALQKTKKAE